MGSFLQSWEWEELQRKMGRKAWRVRGILFILHDIPFGFSYLYCPHPDPGRMSGLLLHTILEEIKKIAKKEGAFFLKIDPLQKLRFIQSGIQAYSSRPLQPQQTIVLDLTESPQKLLSEMHQKTRYNIKFAERHGVRIGVYEGRHEKLGKFDDFFNLLQETAKRDSFSLHQKKYYEELLKIQSPNFSNLLFLAFYRERPIAGALVNISNHEAVYLHGASSNLHRGVMAPHLLHWRIMEEARRRGCRTYDLWGIDPALWPGLTRFKKGFGGREIMHPESVDIVFRPFWYHFYRLKQKFL